MVLPPILGLPHMVAAGILWASGFAKPQYPNGLSVPSHSSTTNTERSLAGLVLLALKLTLKHLYLIKSLTLSALAARGEYQEPLWTVQSFCRHDRRSTLVLDQDYQEFRWLG